MFNQNNMGGLPNINPEVPQPVPQPQHQPVNQEVPVHQNINREVSQPAPNSNVSNEQITKKVAAVEMFNTLSKKRLLMIANIGFMLMGYAAGFAGEYVGVGVAAIGVGINAVFVVKDTQTMNYLQNKYNIVVNNVNNMFGRK